MNTTEVYIRRNKLRRLFETEFHKINAKIKDASKAAGVPGFHLKYSQHLLDRAIQREIDENYVFELFHKLSNHVVEVNAFLELPERPDVEEDLDPNIEYRPLRLEITDQKLWLGFTVSKPVPGKTFSTPYTLNCRMAFINTNRHEGKISKTVINL
ncbi:endoribonuclease [Citrobacter phage Moon]|uniref:Site-specific RNA endonuclease n=2 Tax=Moonvirus TaxID=1985329 RepID=A0A0K1LNK2_9CAUD|nr:endoribonuclease [Citrobacter phage Moon]YP_009203841.1 endoribonuclease [Citrobacter phage Merlin]YP_010843997.1 endoribonuclease [Salmonella phage KM16]AIX12096.1 site-specific endoribonuclease [Citrobacter phage Moon]AKU43773.1 site-specific RNA endonuclease [Citrobacter phage Merlin]